MIVFWVFLGIFVVMGMLVLILVWDRHDMPPILLPGNTEPNYTAQCLPPTIPFKTNEEGELLDRISGEPFHRFPLY